MLIYSKSYCGDLIANFFEMDFEDVSSANKDLSKEFREKYNKYVESRLMHDTICEALNFSGRRHESTSDKSLLEAVKDKFLKSFAVANLKASGTKMSQDFVSNDARDAFLAEFKPEALNKEEKSFLVRELEKVLDKRWRKLDTHLDLFEECPNSEEIEHNDDSELNYDGISRRLETFVDSVNKSKLEKERLCEEVEFKLERCLSQSVGVSKLLKEMLDQIRLKFYANENQLRCEHKLVECDALLLKIKSVANEMLLDMYSEEKLEALNVLRIQIDVNKQITRDKHDQVLNSLASFHALGKDFEAILAEYTELRAQLEKKRWDYETLKKDNII